MSKNKREFDRHPGTGGSIKADAKRSGGGTGNWGDNKAVIGDAVVAHKEATENPPAADTTTNNPPPPKDDLASPENLGDLANAEPPKPQDVSYEEYVKQQSRSGVKAYDARTVANSNFRADRYKGKNQFEKATDELLQGAQKEKKKRKKTRKQQKVIKPEYFFPSPSGIPDNRTGGGAPRGRGRGRGRGGNEGGFNSNRPYGGGGGAGGDRGGYSRGYGGFGSRGRGRRNDENVDNNMPHQRPPPQYRLKNEGNEAAGTTTAPSHQHNNENVSIPQPIV